ncbi:FtsQ-type POTRA domain-containing protein [Microbacterium sp. Marseille-Q6648]|uniref:FtsQ-type POTRA domain-containing protein n=1 Tax=Microbacterium sp. Marseille-Q6648 TaxID=2937991 RepID=UPI00203EEC6B|nr:FtsQ-type POTRA domain-containing protein [Microbacterium sp. Marseille-Q6648]
MRRPTPLPPPPAGSPPAASARRDDDDGRRRAREDRVGEGSGSTERDDTTELAPVIPLAAASDPATPDSAPPDRAAPGSAAADEPISLATVWRAAWARRRALRSEVRRFTGRQRRRRMLGLGVAASLALLVVGSLGAAYSPLFAVEDITVVGASELDAAAVEEALADQLGTPLPLVDDSAVKAALIAFPLVESYALEARPPHELVVRVVERTPIGLISSEAGYTLVDAAGVALSTTEKPAAGRPLLEIRGGTDSEAFDAVGQVMRTLPETIRVQVTAVSASTPDDVTLTLGETDTDIVWGSADESALKAVVLETTMAARPPADVSVYDVSSPDAIVVR